MGLFQAMKSFQLNQDIENVFESFHKQIITWRDSQAEIRFSTFSERSSYSFNIRKAMKLRCVIWESGGCLRSGWALRNFICNVDYKIQIIDNAKFIDTMFKESSYYDVIRLGSDLSFLDETIRSTIYDIFSCFEISYKAFKKSTDIQNFICDYIVLKTENCLKEKGLKLHHVYFSKILLLEKGYDNIGLSADYGVFCSYRDALSADIHNIDNDETVLDTLHHSLDAGLISQEMFYKALEEI